MARKSLSDILRAGDRETLADAWGNTEAAGELEPLPAGEYIALVERGELYTSKTKGTPAYKLTLRIVEGEHDGRHIWHDVWLTPAALPLAKRDLGKLGVTSLDQLERPLPEGIVCAVKVTLRKADDGAEYNRVKRFDVLRIDAPAADAFAPSANGDGAPANATNDHADAQEAGGPAT